jgi:hypothetical protein
MNGGLKLNQSLPSRRTIINERHSKVILMLQIDFVSVSRTSGDPNRTFDLRLKITNLPPIAVIPMVIWITVAAFAFSANWILPTDLRKSVCNLRQMTTWCSCSSTASKSLRHSIMQHLSWLPRLKTCDTLCQLLVVDNARVTIHGFVLLSVKNSSTNTGSANPLASADFYPNP